MDKKTIKNLIILVSVVTIIFGCQFVYNKIVMYKGEFRDMQAKITLLKAREEMVESYICHIDPRPCSPITSNTTKK